MLPIRRKHYCTAALLHDVLEDTDTSKSDLEKEFNNEVAEMVDGVTKLSKLKYASMKEQQVENYRKMFLASFRYIFLYSILQFRSALLTHNFFTKYAPTNLG